MSVNKTVVEAAQVFEALCDDDFQPKSVDQIATALEIPYSTVYRILRSWKEAGWVIETPKKTGKGVLWMSATKLLTIAFAYERFSQERVHSIKNEFKNTSGRELKL